MSDSKETGENSDFCDVTGGESANIKKSTAADSQKLQALNNKLSDDIRDMTGTLYALRVENMKLIRVRKGEKDTWKLEESRLKETISDKNAEIKKLQSKVKRIEKSHSDLTQQNNLLGTEYRELYEEQNRKLSESKVEIEKLKEKILSLETAMKVKDEHICEKVTAEVKAVLNSNQEEMMKKLTENNRENQDKFDTMFNFITEKDRAHKEMMAKKDRVHKEEMSKMLQKIEDKNYSKQLTSEEQKPGFERQPKQLSNERENEVQSNFLVRRFRQMPNERVVTNKETTEIQRLNLAQKPLSLPENHVPIKRDGDGQTYDGEKSDREPSGKFVASNDTTKHSPSLVTKSEQMLYVTEQQQRTSLGRDGQSNFPNIRRQRSINWSTPNAPWKYPQSKKSKS